LSSSTFNIVVRQSIPVMELSWQVQDSEELVIPEEITKQEGGARGKWAQGGRGASVITLQFTSIYYKLNMDCFKRT
jgi:hypothetical protein